MFMLKRCPFCGASNQDLTTITESYLYDWQRCKVAYIQCIKCGGRAGYGTSEQEARRKWNKRA
ncbi:MAG: Lar family restriction alleviation protein [Clostridia bacterium]|nr:Lar family restriction alleviation protein [Clostridia bacterium]